MSDSVREKRNKNGAVVVDRKRVPLRKCRSFGMKMTRLKLASLKRSSKLITKNCLMMQSTTNITGGICLQWPAALPTDNNLLYLKAYTCM